MSAHHRCPEMTRRAALRGRTFWGTVALGVGSICWFLVRVVPKPTRAAYPCQRAAAATAGGFLAWLLGLAGLGSLLTRARQLLRRRRWVGLGAVAAVAVLGLA